jgi:hypothetical protein
MGMVGTKSGCESDEASPYLEPVATYKQFLLGLKSDPRKVFVGTISGPATSFAVELRTPPGGGSAIPALTHSCSYAGAAGPEVADPAVRVAQLVNAVGQHSFASICQQDLSGALVAAAKGIKLMIGDPCIAESLPTNPDCIVTEEVSGAATQTLPSCAGGTKPCWHLVTDPAQCVAQPNLRLQIDRDTAPPPSTIVTMRCLL